MTSPGMKAHNHTDTHKYTLLAAHTRLCFHAHKTGTPPSFSCSVTSLYLTISHLTLQVFSKAAMSSAELPVSFQRRFHRQSPNVDGVRATPGFIYVANYFSPASLVPSISTCLLVFYPPSLQVSLNQTPLMNREADICKKATTTLM